MAKEAFRVQNLAADRAAAKVMHHVPRAMANASAQTDSWK